MSFFLKDRGADGSLRVFRVDAGAQVGPEFRRPSQRHGDRCQRIAMPFSRHLHNEVVNDGLCAVASRLAPGLVVVAVCSAESLEEKSKLGGGRRGDRLSSHPRGAVIPRRSRPFGWSVASFVGVEDVSCVTAVQVRDGRSFETQLGCGDHT